MLFAVMCIKEIRGVKLGTFRLISGSTSESSPILRKTCLISIWGNNRDSIFDCATEKRPSISRRCTRASCEVVCYFCYRNDSSRLLWMIC